MSFFKHKCPECKCELFVLYEKDNVSMAKCSYCQEYFDLAFKQNEGTFLVKRNNRKEK